MQKNTLIHKPVFILFNLFVCILLTACGGNKLKDTETPTISNSPSAPSTSEIYTGKIKIDLTAEPEISFDPNLETTEIILQFIARNEENFPLTPEQVKVTLLLDDEEIDREALIENSAQQLAFNINFGLVLDASYSMIVSHGNEEAFTPMLTSAKNSIQTAIDIWSEQEGTFSFHTTWFNTSIYSSVNNSFQQWGPEDLSFIPRPKPKDFTRLFAATDYAVKRMALDIAEIDQGPRDQNIILVFSDGADNYSYRDDPDAPSSNFKTESDAEYTQLGYRKTSLNNLVETIESQENMSIHVIGLGKAINVIDLQTIAAAGKGLYLENPNAKEIEKPFQRVINEFTTLQSNGAEMPLQNGIYKFTLRVENAVGQETAEYSFNFKIGEGIAEMAPEDQPEE